MPKMSFFNKTIFKKNITLYWPIWGIYTFLLLCFVPGVLWLQLQSIWTGLTQDEKVSRLFSVLEATELHIWLIAITATVAGMALFHYLYNTKSAYMIHALPTNRTELFATNVISGLTFLAVPQVLTFFVTLLLCLSEGITCVEYIGMWLLVMLATDVIAFSIVVVCAMLTGQMIALPFYIIVANGLSWLVGGMMDIMSSIYSYGTSGGADALSSSVVKWFSPLVCYLSEVSMTTSIWTEEDKGMYLNGLPCILVYLVVALVLYAVAYWLYQKRHIEQAGNLVAIKMLKRVFCYMVGIIGGIYGAVIVTLILYMFGFDILKTPVFILLMLIIGALAYFFSDMMVKKTFRVFNRENWISAGICVLIILGCFGGLYGYAEAVQYKIPKESEIEYVVTSLDHRMEYSGENSQWVIDAHREILDNLAYFEGMDVSGAYPYTQEETIYFEYYLKDGTYIYRYYVIPEDNDIGESIIDTYIEREHDVEPFLSNITSTVYYDELEDFSYVLLSYSAYDEKPQNGYKNVQQYDINIYEEENANRLYQAVLADAMAGNLMKYNSGYICDNHVRTYYSEDAPFYMTFSTKSPKNGRSIKFTIFFGADCENILNEMVSLGYVNGTDYLYWQEVITPDITYEIALEDMICEDYTRVADFYCGSLGFKRSIDGASNFASFELDAEQCESLYNAAIREWESGNMISYCYDEHEQMLYLSIIYMNPSDGQPYITNLPFGPDCAYIIKELISMGIIQSEDELEWKNSEELKEVYINPEDSEDASWMSYMGWLISYLVDWEQWSIIEGSMTELITDEHKTVYLDVEEAEKIYIAGVDDAVSGLMKDYYFQYEAPEYQVLLEVMNTATNEREYISFKFGPKCIYLKDVLKELGFN